MITVIIIMEKVPVIDQFTAPNVGKLEITHSNEDGIRDTCQLASYIKAVVLCRRGIFGGIGSRRFIIIESELSSCDFSQLSFTSEYSLNGNGSRSSRSRSSHASSNVSSRLWDFR